MSVTSSNQRFEQLLRRPQSIGGIQLATVRNLPETALIGDRFGAVLTAGPEEFEVNFGFANHRIWSFEDSNDPRWGPRLFQVEEMLFWGAAQDDLIVHCHAGMSRSTATAWGIAMVHGADPHDSLVGLRNAHPLEADGTGRRWFIPNRLLVKHIQEVLAMPDLLAIRDEVLRETPSS